MPTTHSYKASFAPLVAMIDLIIVALSSILAYQLRFDLDSPMDSKFQILTGGSAILVIFCLTITGVYDSWRGRKLLSLLKSYTLGLALATAILMAFIFFTKTSDMFSRLWLGYQIILLWAGGLLYRTGHYLYFRQLRRAGRNLRKVMLVTSNDSEPTSIKGDDLLNAGYVIDLQITVDALQSLLKSSTLDDEIEEVWLNLPLSMGSIAKDIIYLLRHETVDIRLLPDFEDIQLLNHKTSQIAGRYAIDISCSPLDGANRTLKRAEDVILGSLILIPIIPVCLIIAGMIKMTSPGPILFKQHRNGLNGKKVKVYKFRSMEVHNEENGQVTQATIDDPRITKLGIFLRRTSLDELPQFYNVLQGRMSIVGPRPHALAHNEYYKDLVESYMWRHKVKPGITGLAQIRGLRGLTDTIEKMEARVESDLAYIDNWSIWLDLKIIALTVYKGFLSKNAF